MLPNLSSLCSLPVATTGSPMEEANDDVLDEITKTIFNSQTLKDLCLVTHWNNSVLDLALRSLTTTPLYVVSQRFKAAVDLAVGKLPLTDSREEAAEFIVRMALNAHDKDRYATPGSTMPAGLDHVNVHSTWELAWKRACLAYHNFEQLDARFHDFPLYNDNVALITHAIEKEATMFMHASDRLKNMRSIALQAVTPRFDLGANNNLQFASGRLRNDPTVVKAAVNNTWASLYWASDDMKNNEEVVLVAVQKSGLALQHASPEMMDNKKVVEAAVAQNCSALKFANDRWRADRDIVKLAVTGYNPTAESMSRRSVLGLKWASPNMPEAYLYDCFQLAYAMKGHMPVSLELLPVHFQHNFLIVRFVARFAPGYLEEDFMRSVPFSKDQIIEIVTIVPDALGLLGHHEYHYWRRDRDVVLAALNAESGVDAINYVDMMEFQNDDGVFAAMRNAAVRWLDAAQDYAALERVPLGLRDDPFVRVAVKAFEQRLKDAEMEVDG